MAAAASSSSSSGVSPQQKRARSRSPKVLRDCECTICFEPLLPTETLWSCAMCSCVVHIRCKGLWRNPSCPTCRSTRKKCTQAYGGPWKAQARGLVCYICRQDIQINDFFRRCARRSEACMAHWHDLCSSTAQGCPGCKTTLDAALSERRTVRVLSSSAQLRHCGPASAAG